MHAVNKILVVLLATIKHKIKTVLNIYSYVRFMKLVSFSFFVMIMSHYTFKLTHQKKHVSHIKKIIGNAN